MIDTIHNRLIRLATWPVLSLLVVGFIACVLGFHWRTGVLNDRGPDSHFWYTPDDVQELFTKWKKAGHL